MNDLSLEVRREWLADCARIKAELLEMERILRERDEALEDEFRFSGETRISCGCEARKPCQWHQYVELEYGDLKEDK